MGPSLLRNSHTRRLSQRPLTPGALRHKLNLLSPSIGERSLFPAVLTLIVYQGSRKRGHDGYSVARRYHSRGSKQTLQGRECPNKEKITILKSLLVWSREVQLKSVVTGIVATDEFYSRVSNQNSG